MLQGTAGCAREAHGFTWFHSLHRVLGTTSWRQEADSDSVVCQSDAKSNTKGLKEGREQGLGGVYAPHSGSGEAPAQLLTQAHLQASPLLATAFGDGSSSWGGAGQAETRCSLRGHWAGYLFTQVQPVQWEQWYICKMTIHLQLGLCPSLSGSGSAKSPQSPGSVSARAPSWLSLLAAGWHQSHPMSSSTQLNWDCELLKYVCDTRWWWWAFMVLVKGHSS